ncbi:protein xylosyltransferase [Caerostris extrusa]|uniref:protein xylosyltransferase n=1 Tax=Caerostris extrusa TaxID=172846 RepID=A0AAV4XYV0_CAEEX|nr:protein xylosyltransferase [Caerostris extrusa]
MNLLILVLILHGVFAEDIRLPDGRLFKLPKPEEYPYILNDFPSSLERVYILSTDQPNVALSCPKGFSMLEISQEVIANHSHNSSIPKHTANRHSASLLDYYVNQDHTANPPCIVLYDCLGFQACIFEFDHLFCPNLKSISGLSLLLTITCFRDGFGYLRPKFQKQKSFVLYMYQKLPSVLEISNLEHVELPEETVFGRHCSSSDAAKQTEGYFGTCSGNPPSDEITVQHLWSSLGKTLTKDCRNQIVQVYCALQYNNQGFCLPSIYHNKDRKSNQIFSLHSLPRSKYQSKQTIQSKPSPNRHVHLSSTRLAFMIMVYNKPQAVMELINSIYREEYIYVIHVGEQKPFLRKELSQLIFHSDLPSHNVIVLPEERSFVTPLASYETVRAQLEGFQELLYFDDWDFVITLFDDDICLRNIEDLAMALTPYKGLSFLSSLQESTKDNNDESPMMEEPAFTSCDNNVFKISFKQHDSKFKLYRASRSGVFSRKFIAYLLNESIRSKEINDHQFYLQTDSSPVESYIPTVLMNSPFRNSVHLASIQSIYPTTKNSFLSDFYTCKQNIGMECSGFEELISMSHSTFFVKFPSQTPPELQSFATELAKNDYYQLLEKYLPPIILKMLVENAIKRFCAKSKLPVDCLNVESILKFHLTPALIPLDACCRSKLVTSYSKISDFTYWIDVKLFNRTNGEYSEARLMLQPSLKNRFCFAKGNLHMLYLSPWIGHRNPSDSRYDLEIFSPLPYGVAFSDDVLVSIMFSKEMKIHNCSSDLKDNLSNVPLIFNSFNKSITINLHLISPTYEDKCTTNVTLLWDDEKRISAWNKEEVIMKSILIHCKKMEPGQWTLKLSKVEPTQSSTYEFPFLFIRFSEYTSVKYAVK